LDEAKVFVVTPDMVPAYWHLGEYFIRQACKRGPGRLNPENLRMSCEAGNSQYFVAMYHGECVAAAVTNVNIDWPSGHRVLEWTALGGKNHDDWFGLESIVTEAAKSHGCTAMRTYSRIGMKRMLEPLGFKVAGVILEKEI
jgi:hypothetical protein